MHRAMVWWLVSLAMAAWMIFGLISCGGGSVTRGELQEVRIRCYNAEDCYIDAIDGEEIVDSDRALVPPGLHRILVKATDRVPKEKEIYVPRRGGIVVTVILKPLPGRVDLSTRPPGAQVSVCDALFTCKEFRTPVRDLEVTAGLIELVFRLDGHQEKAISGVVAPGKRWIVDEHLEPSLGQVILHCPLDQSCIARIDDDPVQPFRYRHEIMVPSGRHRVQVWAEGYSTVDETIDVKAGGRLDLTNIALRPLPVELALRCNVPGCRFLEVSRGKITGEISARVPAGEVELSISAPGHQVVKHNLHVDPEKGPIPVQAYLVPLKISGSTPEPDAGPIPPGIPPAPPPIDGSHPSLEARTSSCPPSKQPPFGPSTPSSDDYLWLPGIDATLGDRKFGEERAVCVRPFWIGRHEVTVREYRACVEAGGCTAPKSAYDCNWGQAGKEDHPVNCLSALQAKDYASWLSREHGRHYRLPTTSEWERAARAGGRQPYPWGDAEPGSRCNGCDRHCNGRRYQRDEAADDGYATTGPVGRLGQCQGPHGVFDLVGNVAEWTVVDGGGYEARGGSWGHQAVYLLPAYKNVVASQARDPRYGFRLAVSDSDGP